MARLFAGVERDRSPAFDLADMIDAVTRAHLPAPYLLVKPAIHAFIVVRCDDGWCWRLDGHSPRASWSPSLRHTDPDDVAVWEILTCTDDGIDQARADDGYHYDHARIVTQLVGLLPGCQQLLSLPSRPRADICTGIVLRTVAKCGLAASNFAAEFNRGDMYPERLGRELQKEVDGGTAWIKRVTPHEIWR